MAKQGKITIDLKCGFEQWWRYNVYISAATFLDEQSVDYRSLTDTVYPLGRGDEVRSYPEGYNTKRPIHLEIDEGDSLELFIYVIPNTMPMSDAIRQSPPFKMRIAVKGASISHNEEFTVNQWGGASIHLSL